MNKNMLIIFLVVFTVINGWSAELSPVWMFFSGCRGSNDRVLSNGYAYVYTDTTEAVLGTTYSDYAGATLNANPIRLDAAGKADVYSDTVYTYVLQNSGGVRQQLCADMTSTAVVQPERVLSSDGDLASSIAAIGLTVTTLVLDIPSVLTSNLAIPYNVTLRFTPKGIISGSYILTIAGEVDAGPYKIFDSTLTVNSTTMPKIGRNVYAEWFGAVPDGLTDCAPSLQSALNFAQGEYTVKLLSGTYHVASAVTLTSYTDIIGTGGLYGSTLSCAGTSIFEYVALQYTSIRGVTFRGTAATNETAILQTGIPSASYTESCVIEDCNFWKELEECIYANLIACEITRCSFGLYGTVGSDHRHICSLGITGNTTNTNYIEGNRFFNSTAESMKFDLGVGLYCQNNIWEGCDSATYTIKVGGMYTSTFLDNWWEGNSGTYNILLSNDEYSGVRGNYATVFEGSWIKLAPSNTGFLAATGASTSSFINNAGTGFGGGRRVTADNTASQYLNNTFVNYTQELTCCLTIAAKAGVGKGNPNCGLDVAGAIASGTATVQYNVVDGMDVSAFNTVMVNTSGGTAEIGGFTEGSEGQLLTVIKYGSAYPIIFDHSSGDTQELMCPNNIDITIAAPGRGGATFRCVGNQWWAVGVAD